MSTKISDFYTSFQTLLTTLYPNHLKLVNPYNVESNESFALNKGYGFSIGPGLNTDRMVSCQASISRQINFVLCRINRGTERDVVIRETAEKDIFEDQMLLIKQVEKDPQLLQTISRIRYTSDEGIEFKTFDEINYLVLRSSFEIEYLEDLTV